MQRSDAPTNVQAYRQLRQLLRSTGIPLDSLADEIGYGFETVRSWGKVGRSFPDDPSLLAKIVRVILRRGRSISQELTTGALQFLVLAGYPVTQLDALIDQFPPDQFRVARRTALALVDDSVARALQQQAAADRLHDAAPHPDSPPQPLPPGSLPLPFPPYPRFRGRDAILASAFCALRDGQHVALVGLGGAGKTLLASELAHRFGAYFAGGVFWLNAEELKQLPAQVARCGGAEALALHPGFSQLGLDAQLQLVRAAWEQPIPRLIVLDNAEDLQALELAVPLVGGCRVLITSQRGDWVRLPGVQLIALGGLPRVESVALLADDLADAGDSATIGELDQLAAEVGDLPLGLLLVSRYLRQSDLPLEQRITLLLELLQRSTNNTTPMGGPTHYGRGIGAMISAMLARLDLEDTTDQLALRLLVSAACLAPGEPIDRDLLVLAATGRPNAQLDERTRQRYGRALERLLELGLVERGAARNSGAAPRIRIHRLIAAAVGNALRGEVAATLLQVWRSEFTYNNTSWAEPHLVHLTHLAETGLAAGEDSGGLLGMELGWHLTLTSRHEAAIAYQRRSLDLLRQLRGWDDESAESLCRLALAYQFLGQMQTAERYWDQLLEIDQARLPANSLALALTFNNVGYIKINVSRPSQASQYLRAALRIRRSQLPLIHHDIARTLYLLSRLGIYLGRYRNTRRYLRLAIGITEALPDMQRLTLLRSHLYAMLGENEYERGDYPAALAAASQAHALRRQHFQELQTPDGRILHQLIAADLYSFGRIAAAQGDSMGALRYYREALAINEQLMGLDNPESAGIVEALGIWHGERGHLAQALSLLAYARDTFLSKVSPVHPQVARIELSIARVWLHQEAWAEAERALDMARATMQRSNLEPHPMSGWIAASYGELALARGQVELAQTHYRQAIALIAPEAPHHPWLALYRLRV